MLFSVSFVLWVFSVRLVVDCVFVLIVWTFSFHLLALSSLSIASTSVGSPSAETFKPPPALASGSDCVSDLWIRVKGAVVQCKAPCHCRVVSSCDDCCCEYFIRSGCTTLIRAGTCLSKLPRASSTLRRIFVFDVFHTLRVTTSSFRCRDPQIRFEPSSWLRLSRASPVLSTVRLPVCHLAL